MFKSNSFVIQFEPKAHVEVIGWNGPVVHTFTTATRRTEAKFHMGKLETNVYASDPDP